LANNKYFCAKSIHLSATHFITANCIISNGIVNKDGSALFQNEGTDLLSFLRAAYQHFQLNYNRWYKMDNLCKLGWLASEILLKDTFKKEDYNSEDIGVILANRNSSLDNDLRYFNSIKDFPSPSLFVYTLPNIVIGEIAIRNQFKGEHAFYIQEQFDPGFIKQQVDYLLSNDLLKVCICGWVDVLKEDYKAVLFLVEKQTNNGRTMKFSFDNMNSIFNDN
jgi:hypothetical protein